tara:strand:+ start:55 stop:690 length:636 start_codon:yes stop_codon:yes gene_type:complete
MPAKSKSTSARKSRTTSKKAKTTTPAPEPEPVVEVAAAPAEPVVEESVAPVSTEPTLDDQFKDILTRLQQFRTLSQTLMADVRKLQKNVTRQVRESARKNKKRKATGDSKRPPSGFAKPTLISDSLCQFLGVESGTMMARTEVTKHLTKYIKAHELQDAANKRIINCDTALAGLLNVQPSDEVTYFNLQRYMKPHFPQSAANLAAAAQSSA